LVWASLACTPDHAATQKKMFRLVEEELQRRRALTVADQGNLLGDVMLAAFCWDHKRTNTAGATEKGDQDYLASVLGNVKDPGEWGNSSVTAALRISGKAFGHRENAYVYGHGVKDFPHWIKVSHPTFHWAGLLTIVGNRNDVYFENAMVAIYMANKYAEYLFYLRTAKKDGLNKLEAQLLKMLACQQVLTALRARALIWCNIFQPLRNAANGTDMGLSMLDMELYAEKTEEILDELATGKCPKHFFQKGGYQKIYKRCPKFKQLCKDVGSYRQNHSHEIDAVFDFQNTSADANKKKALTACLELQATHGLAKFRCFASSQLASQAKNCGSKDYCPKSLLRQNLSPAEINKLKRTPPVNRNAERLFSRNDLTRRRYRNASQYVVSGLTSAQDNGTIEWLYSIEDPAERDALIMFALSKEGMAEGKRLAAEAEAAQDEAHRENEAEMREKANKNRLAAMKRWLKAANVKRHDSVKQWAAEYTNFGKQRSVTARREWLANQMSMLTHEGVGKGDFPGLFKRNDPKKKRDPDDIFKDLKQVFAKWKAGTLKLVPEDERPRNPNKPDKTLFEYRAAGENSKAELTQMVVTLLEKEEKAHAKMAKQAQQEVETVVAERKRKAEARKKLKVKRGAKKKGKGKAKAKGKPRPRAKAPTNGSESDREEEEELDSEEEEQADMDVNYVFQADLRRALKASKAPTTSKPTKRQRRVRAGPGLR
jgi:hypothetical protein